MSKQTEVVKNAYAVRYKYVRPASSGPFKGMCMIFDKPAKGDTIYAPFGPAIVISVRKVASGVVK